MIARTAGLSGGFRAGGDVRRRVVQGAGRRTASTAPGRSRATTPPARPARRRRLRHLPRADETCPPGSGLSVSGAAGPGRKTVKADDGAAWTFHAPAGTTVRRVKVWRYTAAAVEHRRRRHAGRRGRHLVGHRPRGRLDAGGATCSPGETCSGTTPSPTRPTAARARRPSTRPTRRDLRRHRPAGGQLGPPVHAAASRRTRCASPRTVTDSTNAGLELRGATVTVEDLAAPERGAQRAASTAGCSRAIARTLVASDSAGVRSAAGARRRRRAGRTALRLRLPPRRAVSRRPRRARSTSPAWPTAATRSR